MVNTISPASLLSAPQTAHFARPKSQKLLPPVVLGTIPSASIPAKTMSRRLPETVLVGSVVRPHGLRGDVVVVPLSDVGDRFDVGSQLFLCHPDGRVRRETVRRSSGYRDRLLIGFESCVDRAGAEAVRGAELRVGRHDVPGAGDGQYYYFELVDCLCRDAVAGDLGPVVAVIEDGGGLLLEVDRGGQKVLIPFVRSFLRRIDIEAGEIDLDLPPGLLETCVSTS